MVTELEDTAKKIISTIYIPFHLLRMLKHNEKMNHDQNVYYMTVVVYQQINFTCEADA